MLDSLADATRLIRIIAVMTKHERTGLHPPRQYNEVVANAFICVIAVIEGELETPFRALTAELDWNVGREIALVDGRMMRRCLDHLAVYAINKRLDAKQPAVEAYVIERVADNECRAASKGADF